eukprot:7056847-Lingulodinium_polyedra.AAC.1
MASAQFRWAMSAAKRLGCCLSVLLVDVKSAYYSVFHALLDLSAWSDSELADIIDDSEVPLAFVLPLRR